ncbi:interleukin-4 [Erinaceus europaeus]|uniref:Interleukin-4 n=1 Tax=Erinaceus europaeus TaxID=9365 RepID=A0ABM3X0M8_ERIEU|nr:interleukin-4 [Erinaceus europaeus]
MDFTSQLIPTLVCLLVCTSNCVFGHTRNAILKEIIKTLNILTEKKNTTEKETFCRAASVLRQVYKQQPKCRPVDLRKLDRNLTSMTNMNCPVNEARRRTLKDFLERLKTIMKAKYSKC